MLASSRGQSRNIVNSLEGGGVFHGMENIFAIFPRYGKIVSMVWKTSRGWRFA